MLKLTCNTQSCQGSDLVVIRYAAFSNARGYFLSLPSLPCPTVLAQLIAHFSTLSLEDAGVRYYNAFPKGRFGRSRSLDGIRQGGRGSTAIPMQSLHK